MDRNDCLFSSYHPMPSILVALFAASTMFYLNVLGTL